MEFLSEILIVGAILAVVAVAAVSFEPANPLEPWLRLAQRYSAGQQPGSLSFPDQDILFGSGRSRLKSMAIAAKFDAEIDDFGLWIIYKGPLPEEVVSSVRIPGTHVRFGGQHGQHYLFELYAEPPVKMGLRGELGEKLMQRCNSATA
jgi:hypothetical protein